MSSFAPRHPSEERSASCHTPELPINASSSSRPPPTSPIHLPSYARDQSISSNPPSGHRPRNTPPTSYGAPSHHMIGHDPLFNSSASVPLSPSRKLDQPTQARSSSEVHLALQASQSGSRPLATSSASLYAPPTAPTANGRHGDLSSRLGPISRYDDPLQSSNYAETPPSVCRHHFTFHHRLQTRRMRQGRLDPRMRKASAQDGMAREGSARRRKARGGPRICLWTQIQAASCISRTSLVAASESVRNDAYPQPARSTQTT